MAVARNVVTMGEQAAGNTDRVREILSWYESDNPGVKTNLARLLNAGRLAGTGKFVILPVDQGFEHGPARSFAVNPGRGMQRLRGAVGVYRVRSRPARG